MQQAEARANDEAVGLFRNGHVQEARSILETFLKANPQSVLARVNLGYMLFTSNDLEGARDAYERAIRQDPRCVQAYHGLSSVFYALGNEDHSAVLFDRACRLAPIRKQPYLGGGSATNVLLLCSASIANLNAYALLDPRAFAVTTAFVEYADFEAMQGNDVIFNAISEPERANEALDCAQSLVTALGVRAVNAPAVVRATTRENNARRLAAVEGAVVPALRRVSKAALFAGELPIGVQYPAIVRAIGHHDGRYMMRVDDREELVWRASELPGDELFVIQYIDVRSADGNVRKYRVIITGDELHPLHLAVSHRWKVHYATSDMEGSPEHRAEDAQFLRDPQAAVGDRAMAALHAVRVVLQLDYGGIDFALDRGGNAVIFEANASMFVPPVRNDAKWDYRREPTARILDAVTRLVASASSRPTASESPSA